MNHEIEPESKELTIDIFTFINNLWRGLKKLGLLLVALTAVSSGLICLFLYRNYSPLYTASSTFTVNLNLDANNSIYEDSMRASQMSKTFPYILSCSVLKDIIAQDLGTEYVSESIKAESVEGSNLFTISVTAQDAQWSYRVLQSVIKNYPKIAETVVGDTHLNMLEETGVPKEPSNQLNKRSSLIKGAIPGAVLGILIIIIYAVFRRTVYRIEDITAITSLKHLGTLPEVVMKKRGKKNNINIVLNNAKLPSSYRENIYKIRTRVEKAANNKGLKSILITSAIPGEGKSTIALNLALAIAEGGKRVVLADCDFRHPSISKMLQLSKDTPDFINIINEEAELKDALVFLEELNITVLACNQPVENSSEVIGTDKVYEILEELEQSYDYVILDTAPSIVISDISYLAKFADGAIYVIKQDYSKLSQILEGLEYLSESSSIDILGCILNGSRKGLVGYGYGYGYGYGSSGNYGYGKKKQNDGLVIEE